MLSRLNRFAAVVSSRALAGLASAGTSDPSAEPTTKPAPSTITIDAYWVRLTPKQLPAGQAAIPPSLLSDADAVYARARVVGFEPYASKRVCPVVSGMSDHPGSPDARTLCLVLCATLGPAK